ncbi:MAG TPA: hypothetical protein VGM54_25435 [Chthoniobacter sp.]
MNRSAGLHPSLDARGASRCHVALMRLFCALLLVLTASVSFALTPRELDVIGRRVWQNECGGTREGLTSWNSGENFASLGIGHFIWYPKGVTGPFEESFPMLIKSLAANGVKVPAWIKPEEGCPWSTRAEFLAASKSEKMSELRDFLASTIQMQARFLVQRMENALSKMLAVAPSGQRAKIKANYDRLVATPRGLFALVDYVNFKGEGTKDTERYQGEGWGLLQVLANMGESEGASPAALFAKSAEEILARRVRNAPPERHEERWLNGWKNRVRAYVQ